MKKSDLIDHIDQPEEIEKLYRKSPLQFAAVFMQAYPEIPDRKFAEYWKIRLEYERAGTGVGDILKTDFFYLLPVCLISCFIAEIPNIFPAVTEPSIFFFRNGAIIIFLGMVLYTLISDHTFRSPGALVAAGLIALSAVYINLLPAPGKNDAISLACIFLPVFLWFVLGFVYTRFQIKNLSKRTEYIRDNGDLAVLSTLILIAGGILAVLSAGLFRAIGIEVETFIAKHLAIWGIVSAPAAATFIIRNYPSVANKIAPVIARIFSPLILATLLVFLGYIAMQHRNPYSDRNFLLVFNFMLLVIVAVILFSIAGTMHGKGQGFNRIVISALVVVSIVIDIIALSAIIYRLGEYGFTPNRTAVLGTNLTVLGNLILIASDLYKVNFRSHALQKVEHSVASYLPVYFVWTIVVVFVFPFAFDSKLSWF